MSRPIVISNTPLNALYTSRLNEFFEFHDRPHLNDAALFQRLAPEVRALAAGGESKVPAEFMDQLPKLELISVMGTRHGRSRYGSRLPPGSQVTRTASAANVGRKAPARARPHRARPPVASGRIAAASDAPRRPMTPNDVRPPARAEA